MREFTPEEKELIVNTPITLDLFSASFVDKDFKRYCRSEWENLISVLERIRIMSRETENDEIIENFISMLPNSYKVVKL